MRHPKVLVLLGILAVSLSSCGRDNDSTSTTVGNNQQVVDWNRLEGVWAGEGQYGNVTFSQRIEFSANFVRLQRTCNGMNGYGAVTVTAQSNAYSNQFNTLTLTDGLYAQNNQSNFNACVIQIPAGTVFTNSNGQVFAGVQGALNPTQLRKVAECGMMNTGGTVCNINNYPYGYPDSATAQTTGANNPAPVNNAAAGSANGSGAVDLGL